jgi:CopG family nickel-responsive transcriptional regulator
MTVERVGIAFEPDLLEKFDALIKEKGYTNRSEAVRDLVRKSIMESQVKNENRKAIGTLSILYDHDVGNVVNELVHVQHHRRAEILTTTHIHVSESSCLEVLIVKGKSDEIRKLADNIKAIKGVKHGELVVTATSP